MQRNLTPVHIEAVIPNYLSFIERLGRELRAYELDDVYDMAIHGETVDSILYLMTALSREGLSYREARMMLSACVPGTTVETLIRGWRRIA